jgi:hypothetical protein
MDYAQSKNDYAHHKMISAQILNANISSLSAISDKEKGGKPFRLPPFVDCLVLRLFNF